jgi:hypothetical protein
MASFSYYPFQLGSCARAYQVAVLLFFNLGHVANDISCDGVGQSTLNIEEFFSSTWELCY